MPKPEPKRGVVGKPPVTPRQRRIMELRRERANIAAQIRWLEMRDTELFSEIMTEVAKDSK